MAEGPAPVNALKRRATRVQASAAILEASVGRLPLQMVVDTAPLSFYLGADLIIMAGVLFDWRTRGSIHAVWLWGGGALILSQFVRVAVMNTGPWLAFAHGVAALS